MVQAVSVDVWEVVFSVHYRAIWCLKYRHHALGGAAARETKAV